MKLSERAVPPIVFSSAALLCALFLPLSACLEREVAQVEPRQSVEQEQEIDVDINRDLDILFVIDNSLSMEQEQDSLASNFGRFINVLNNIEGGLPNVHIGVASTDLAQAPAACR